MAKEPNITDTAESTGRVLSGEAPPNPKTAVKVELDLDGAPFLEEDDDEPEPEPEKKVSEPAAKQEKAAPEPHPSFKDKLLANKKKLILAAAAAALLLVSAVAINVFLSGDPTPPRPSEPEPEKVSAAPKPLPEAPVPQYTMSWEPFWVELKDTEGGVRFLTITFSVPTDNPVLFGEMNAKRLILRDALFYYLRNQPIISLQDEQKVQAFKSDLLTVMNEHLSSGKVAELLIEDYLIQ